ncbi:hypothetical protein DSO57_1011627 [Entomophthora muscae]|uniref:Uncharacterized protein n=1 Tax=Entomophthora muscae TaxID=34485 RepID=A0ACC2URM3_9FUNG|nr:hypothetical protein DSO57_1011627 [Entomophthora muscae]
MVRFLAFAGLVVNQAFGELTSRPLRLGKNPAGFRYHLPEGAKWNGNGSFTEDHYFPESNHHMQCVDNGGTIYCLQETSRYIQVFPSNKKYTSPCWFADCYIKVKFTTYGWPLVNIFDITDDPIFDFRYAPFFPKGECFGTEAIVLAPGRFYSTLEMYHINLVVNLKATVDFGGQNPIEEDFEIINLSVAIDGACDCFLSHTLN